MNENDHDNPSNIGFTDNNIENLDADDSVESAESTTIEDNSQKEFDDDYRIPVVRRQPEKDLKNENKKDTRKIEKIELDKLIPFTLCNHQEYQGQRLTELMNSIDKAGLLYPIIVRPLNDEKYEIICGHNRVNAIKVLGDKKILADIRTNLSDEEAIRLFYDSNLNQQNFNDWSHSQKIDAIKYINGLITEQSQQGKRTDLGKKEVKVSEKLDEGTSVQNVPKLDKDTKRNNTRDKMARNFGIATSTFSKYRRIIKLQENEIAELIVMLDSRRLNLDLAYRISSLKNTEVKTLLGILKETPDFKPSARTLKQLGEASKASKNDLTEKEIKKIVTEALK